MVVVLTGENSFAWQQELQSLTKAFVAKYSDVALERLDGEEASFERLQEALTSLPFLANKKMVVLRTPSANKQFTDQAESLFLDIPETTDVILVEPKLDKRLSYYKFLKKSTDFKTFPELDTPGLAKWLVSEAGLRQGNLNSNDAHYLVERVGANQQLLSNELNKLLLYDSNVTRQTIDLLTEATPQSTVFQLLEAAFAGKRRDAMHIYEEQRALKVEPQQIIAMLTWQLHIMAIIKTAADRTSDQIAKEAKLNPFVVRKSSSIAKRLSFPELKQLISRLQDIDIKSKTVTYNLDDALRQYLLAISS